MASTKEQAREAAWVRRKAAQDALKDIKREAGIAEATDALTESVLEGADDEDTRRVVFAIPDPTLRKRVIAAYRELDLAFLAYEEAELSVAWERERDDGNKTRSNELAGAVVFAVVLTLIAYASIGMIGALVAAVATVLLGFSHLQRAERMATREAEQARELAHEQEQRIVG